MSTLSFHFHGYQPGDIVRWREPDPLRPQTFEQRHSPVVLRIGPDHVEGRNWTDAVLRTYGRMGSVLHRASGSASVDIEPQTLVWLLERDPSAYRAIIAAYDSGTAGFVMTPPFHPILPHLHRQEREALFDLMFDFYSPLIQRAEGRPIGLWLPEAAYSHETMDSFRESARQASVELDAIGDSLQSVPAGTVLSSWRTTSNPSSPTRCRQSGSNRSSIPSEKVASRSSLPSHRGMRRPWRWLIIRAGRITTTCSLEESHRTRAGPGFADPMDSWCLASIGIGRCPSSGSTPSPWRL